MQKRPFRGVMLMLLIVLFLMPGAVLAQTNKGYMGLEVDIVGAEDIQRLGLKDNRGVIVTQVAINSNAARAGIVVDDVLLYINETAISSVDEFKDIISHYSAGDKVGLTYLRNNVEHTQKFTFGRSPQMEKPKKMSLNKKQKKLIIELLETINVHNKSMGCLAIGKGKKILLNQAIGFKSLVQDKPLPADIDTKYRIASLSKIFTAVMIYQLVEEGFLALDTTLDVFFPTIPNSASITVSMLLNHTSGIFSFTELPDYHVWSLKHNSNEDMISRINSCDPVFQPGEKYQYSNSNYLLLGYMIEILDSCSYAEALKSRITDRIGLKNTYYGAKISIGNNEAQSYLNLGYWELSSETDMSVPGGAGGIVSTAADLVVFMGALFEGRLLTKLSLKNMLDSREGRANGIFELRFGNQVYYGHTGHIDGFHTILIYHPRYRYAIAYLANGEADLKLSVIALVTGIMNHQQVNLPRYLPVMQVEDPEGYAGEYRNSELDMELLIKVEDKHLFAYPAGQGKIGLQAVSKYHFECASLGVTIRFEQDRKSFSLIQGEETYLFHKGEQGSGKK